GLAIALALVVPVIVTQLSGLVTNAPQYGEALAGRVLQLQRDLTSRGINVDLATIYAAIPERLAAMPAAIASQSVALVGGALTQSLELAVGTFIAVAVIQNVMTNFVGPRLMAQTVGIHPLLVFAALLVGARVAGLWGVFLALPIAGILNVFARYALEVASGRRARTEASRMLSEREQRRARR